MNCGTQVYTIHGLIGYLVHCACVYVVVCCECLLCSTCSCVLASVTFPPLLAQGESTERLVGRHRLLPSLSDDSVDGEEASEETEVISLRQRSSETLKQVGTVACHFLHFSASCDLNWLLMQQQVMYFLTEREQFRPRREKHK